MKPLYALVQQHRELERLADSEELDEATLFETLNGLQGEIELKAQSVAAQTLNIEAWAQAAEDAAKRIQERAARMRKRAEWLRAYIKVNMQGAGLTKVESPEFAIAIRKNPPSVEIAPGIILPKAYMVTPPPAPDRPNKTAIAIALKAGEEIEGCRLVQTERLEIR